MTAKEFAFGIFTLGMTAPEFAAWLCMDRSAVYRWVSGEIAVPRYAELIVNYMLDAKK